MEVALAEVLAGRFEKKKWISLINAQSSYFEQAVIIAFSDEQPQAWRATWVLGHCMKKNDPRFQPHLEAMIEAAKTKQDGHQREWLKILERMTLDEDQEGLLFDVCMTIWESLNKSPSVRITAFRILHKLAKKYPELNNEMEFLTQDHYTETLTPGVKRSLEKMLNQKNKR